MGRESTRRIAELLLAERSDDGVWAGRLSSSALSTATAAIAARLSGGSAETAENAVRWLTASQNDDGGWGDTPDSPSNLPTTLLAKAALDIPPAEHSRESAEAAGYLANAIGAADPTPREIATAVSGNYGDDKTFSVPILLALAAAEERSKNDTSMWKLVPRLPFELAVLPDALFAAAGVPVVSYALPALISMGIAVSLRNPPKCPIRRMVGALTRRKALGKLAEIQPDNGGFLEAVPLTSFVAISLSSAGFADSPITRRCLQFIEDSARPDGSLPIDTNLATWLTSLSIGALPEDALDSDSKRGIRGYLSRTQLVGPHPYTNARPGGWPWTHLPGGVPDADDTSAALLALKKLDDASEKTRAAAEKGVAWLLDLQNNDGGIPTFRKGWGKFEFDRSCPDITAHALSAFSVWRGALPEGIRRRVAAAGTAALEYLERTQAADGSWTPLWFGNQSAENKANPLFGTALVAIRLAGAMERNAENAERLAAMLEKASDFILGSRSGDGGWGWSPNPIPPFETSSIEETSLAVAALAETARVLSKPLPAEAAETAALVRKAFDHADGPPTPTPLGLYFASLWYSERLYPAIFAMRMETALNDFKPKRR